MLGTGACRVGGNASVCGLAFGSRREEFGAPRSVAICAAGRGSVASTPPLRGRSTAPPLPPRASRKGASAPRRREEAEEEEDLYEEEDESAASADDDEDFDFDPEHASPRLFLDSADVGEWERWQGTGLICGVTTNPTILRRDGVRCNLSSLAELADRALELGIPELQLQAWGPTPEALARCAAQLQELGLHVVVKLPCTEAGLAAAAQLAEEGAAFTLTGAYAAEQAVVAAAAGASYLAPYLGRMDDADGRGMEALVAMRDALEWFPEPRPELLVASVRSAAQVAALAAGGFGTMTLAPRVLEELCSQPLTEAAAAQFEADAAANA
ncbi:hypothetical protein H632_c309p1 [Helicosporidium sp. ATCC 50920]|nr:hypothetical protein H632_c309p1 [Helicosporidium sp. ATCC 50920]|eukprot:KDD76223.1 hypothetical protein H632_c309p1 [Helicosporidium sp. ATCC 50920]